MIIMRIQNKQPAGGDAQLAFRGKYCSRVNFNGEIFICEMFVEKLSGVSVLRGPIFKKS